MWPKIGPIDTYAVMYLAGIFCHFFLTGYWRRRLWVSRFVQVCVSVAYMVGMTFGAKLLYDVHAGQFSWGALFRAGHYLEGGLWGGLLAYIVLAGLVVLVSARRRGAGLDLAALSIPIPWVLAKLGCLLNGCCYGRACTWSWAITFPQGGKAPAGVALHPTQLYEIAAMLAIGVVMWVLSKRSRRGTMLLWFVVLYGIARGVIDFWRGDAGRHVYVGPVTITQLVCLGGAAGAAGLLWLVLRVRKCEQSTATYAAHEDIIREVQSL